MRKQILALLLVVLAAFALTAPSPSLADSSATVTLAVSGMT